MIDIQNISPEAILKDLEEYIKNQPGDLGWKDFFEGGAGQTILELLSAVLASKNHYQLARLRESSLQYAILDSSITQLAYNKGVYRPPAKCLLMEFEIIPSKEAFIPQGQQIGMLNNYSVYSLEPIRLYKNVSQKIRVIIGNKEKHEAIINSNEDFFIQKFDLQGKYLGNYLERCKLEGDDVILVNRQLNLYNLDLPSSVLRIPSQYEIKLIFGDGVLGKKTERNQKIIYECITFSDDLLNTYKKSKPNFFDEEVFNVQSYSIVEEPAPYMDKEILRRIATRHSVDGRWVESKDFENGLISEFYHLIHDIFAEDRYPDENIYILPKQELSDEYKEKIMKIVDDKKGNAVKVNFFYIPESDGVERNASFTYVGTDSDEVINEAIQNFKKKVEYKISKTDVALPHADIAVEITRHLPKGKIYADDISKRVEVEKYKFLKKLHISYLRYGEGE